MNIYAWLKAFHIIAVIAWMAGMLYLPRLFVYHCAAEKGSDSVGNVQGDGAAACCARIINPAMIATWVLGLWLGWLGPDSRFGWFDSGWLQAKIVLVLLLSAVHGLFARWVKDFAADSNRHSQRFYRIINEVPTAIMIADRAPGGAETVLISRVF